MGRKRGDAVLFVEVNMLGDERMTEIGKKILRRFQFSVGRVVDVFPSWHKEKLSVFGLYLMRRAFPGVDSFKDIVAVGRWLRIFSLI